MTSKINKHELNRMRELTMGCWWSSKAYPKSRPNYAGIAGELTALTDAEEFYFTERGNNLARLHELRALRQLAKDQVESPARS